MKCPPVPLHEKERLAALESYGLAEESPLVDLSPVVQMARHIFKVPMAAVNMVGTDHVFFAASAGIGAVDMRRDVSFCAHAILQDDVMVVANATQDERFHDNPLVSGGGLRFYAGVPLLSADGHALGALCLLDTRPRGTFTPADRGRLHELARMAMDRLELHRIGHSTTRSGDVLRGRAIDPEQLAQLAKIDPLTGLASRRQFYRVVEATLLAGRACGVLMFDVDGFKDVNNILGPEAGDEILRAVGRLLSDEAGKGVTVARIGSDEFAVLVAELTSEAADALAHRLLAKISDLTPLPGEDQHISASCGVALSPRDASEAVELIGDADLALHAAKASRSATITAFSPDLRNEAADRRLSGMDLHRAVSDSELLLFYQPQVRLCDGAVVGAEALLRWLHPSRGLLSPGAFLGALEAGPLAPAVGRWVIDEACAQAARWRRQGAIAFRMAVNLFGSQFRSGDLTEQVEQALARHGLPPEALELEITENIVLSQDVTTLDALNRLRQMGVGIAFDDFGTGYASLSLLTRYPVSCIKIDRTFVDAMLRSPREAAVICAILEMGRALEMGVIAEGIETEEQRDYLVGRSCPTGQGYLFGKAMPAPEFEIAARRGAVRSAP